MTNALNPLLSRRSLNQTMAARGMRSAAELAAGKPCGTRVRYYAGCRCAECKAANTTYERERQAARARGETNRLVSAERARAHLAALSAAGVGRKTAADAAKVSASTVSKVIDGQRLKIREQAERRILAVTPATAADGARTDGAPTWLLLDELLASGYSRARLSTELLGYPSRSLQISRAQVTVRTAEQVRQLHARLCIAPPADQRQAQAQLAELREEHYRLDRIQREIDDLAAARGWGKVSITTQEQRGRWPGPTGLTHRAAALIDAVHARLIGEVAP